jgi:hypothetical protein
MSHKEAENLANLCGIYLRENTDNEKEYDESIINLSILIIVLWRYGAPFHKMIEPLRCLANVIEAKYTEKMANDQNPN